MDAASPFIGKTATICVTSARRGRAIAASTLGNAQPTQALYPVDLFVIAADRKGLLRDVSSVFSDADVDVVGVNTHSDRTLPARRCTSSLKLKTCSSSVNSTIGCSRFQMYWKCGGLKSDTFS
ncbi:ACT domain-containing protein [Chromatium okenii]|uniref:ACT domain-containing protein n=1 Tax=Chromatium okenii TaxID=61644 RepID=UPI003D6BA280